MLLVPQLYVRAPNVCRAEIFLFQLGCSLAAACLVFWGSHPVRWVRCCLCARHEAAACAAGLAGGFCIERMLGILETRSSCSPAGVVERVVWAAALKAST